MLWSSRSKKKRHGVLLDYPSPGDSLCNECDAACCRSFPAVNITGIEYNQLRLIGATRLQFSLIGRHKLLIENGCEFLKEGKCSIYEQRPNVCQRFMCQIK
ncbi:MAG: YkgJ family cysteine cluster protein [Desulfuromonadaceae bacterium]|nr:YkgJ family cysteine cluster protein [Desulfuromonadaceae bacterium]